MTFQSRAIAAIEAAFDEAVKERFVMWSANIQPSPPAEFAVDLSRLNLLREAVIAELKKQEDKT